ncbi:MAG: hypothetical protein OHM56_07350 [Spiroplasma phoeniceum]|nr:MAG: hypothetical protein OHM57_06750 [Spiroplasma phoeniceum]UZQ31454.1 MAG: hypothetical protein OHM56_07350 [Spiroplasma phoeniceum]
MFNLTQTTGLVYFIFIIVIGLLLVGWLIFGLILLRFKKKKTTLKPRILLRKMLDDNDLQDVNIGEQNHIVKARNFSKISNAVIIRIADDKDQSIVKIYDMIFHFYYIYNQKTKKSKCLFLLKFLSWFLLFTIFLFIVAIILVILIQFLKDNTVINGIDITIKILSIIGVVYLILGWFCWANLVENYRQDLIALAIDYLPTEFIKSFKSYASFKAFFPFSENVICFY